MGTEGREGSNPVLDELRALSLAQFRGRYSARTAPSSEFDSTLMYPRSNETIFPHIFDEIDVRGGIHLAVAGGLDPALAQVARMDPDLSILCDINLFAVHMIDTRLHLIGDVEDGRQYWQRFQEVFESDPLLIPHAPIAGVSESDYWIRDWSSDLHFPAVKKAWQDGIIKFIHADITTDGLEAGGSIARNSGVPIKLISLSNIFDYHSNQRRLAGFKERLRNGLVDGTVDSSAQVVTATTYSADMEHTIWRIGDFIKSFTP